MGNYSSCAWKSDEIIRMHVDEKMSCNEISIACSSTNKAIKKILENAGVYNPEYSKIYRGNLEIRRMLEDGKTQREIARTLGVRPETISIRIKKHNLRDGLCVKKEEKIDTDSHVNYDRHLCKKCMYRTNENLRKTYGMHCDYIEIVGKSRKCNPEDCDKYVKGNPVYKKRRIAIGSQLIA